MVWIEQNFYVSGMIAKMQHVKKWKWWFFTTENAEINAENIWKEWSCEVSRWKQTKITLLKKGVTYAVNFLKLLVDMPCTIASCLIMKEAVHYLCVILLEGFITRESSLNADWASKSRPNIINQWINRL